MAKMGVDEEQMETLMEESYLYSVVYDTLAKECEVNADEMNSIIRKTLTLCGRNIPRSPLIPSW